MPFVPALIGGTSNEQLATASRPGQRAAVTNGPPRFGCFVPAFFASRGPCIGWKQCQGRHRRPHAERSAASTERVRMAGAAAPLMLVEAREPIGKGEGRRAKPATPAPAASRARTDAGCNRRGCPSEARRVPDGDRITRSRKIRCHQKKTPPKRGCGCAFWVIDRTPCRPTPCPSFCPCFA